MVAKVLEFAILIAAYSLITLQVYASAGPTLFAFLSLLVTSEVITISWLRSLKYE